MRKKQAALYSPFLDVMGGGERHVLSIVKVLEDEGYEITIFWNKNIARQIREKLHIEFHKLKFAPNIFTPKQSAYKRLKTLSKFDVFIYVTDGSYFTSSAKKNFIFAMVPDAKLYRMGIVNRIKTANFRFIAISHFTQKFLYQQGIQSVIIYPYIDTIFFAQGSGAKQNFILCVGRFFKHLHSKRQDLAIKAFKAAKDLYPEFKNYKLILAGGAKKEDHDYLKSLEKLRNHDSSIMIKPNIEFHKLTRIYKNARIYWHLAGYGTDEKNHPEQVEHLGITPLEAQAAACITICYNAGGIREIIKDGVNGITFTSLEELVAKTQFIINHPKKQKPLTRNAINFVHKNFSHSVFKKRVTEVLLNSKI